MKKIITVLTLILFILVNEKATASENTALIPSACSAPMYNLQDGRQLQGSGVYVQLNTLDGDSVLINGDQANWIDGDGVSVAVIDLSNCPSISGEKAYYQALQRIGDPTLLSESGYKSDICTDFLPDFLKKLLGCI